MLPEAAGTAPTRRECRYPKQTTLILTCISAAWVGAGFTGGLS
jgi:hypothetical protein